MSNVSLTTDLLPRFSQISPDTIKQDVQQAIEHCKNTIETALADQSHYTWQNLVVPIDEADDQLSRLWSPIGHLNSVKSSDELREAYESCLPLLSEYSTYVGQHTGLYKAYEYIANSEEFKQLSQPKQKVINDALRDFKLSGIALSEEKQKRYGEIVSRLSELGSTFSNNLLDATQAFSINITNEDELSGLPQSAKDAAKELASSKDKQGWLFTLDFPSYLPVMMYADNDALREQMYRAFATRASDQGPNGGEYDNSQVMTEILSLRHELATLLDFSNFAEKSLATKMATSTQEVFDFLNNLADKSKAQGQADYDEIITFAKNKFGKDNLQAWDLPYYSEKLKQDRYAISDEQLRPYFPEERAVNGLFTVVNKLFNITIEPRDNVDTWHQDVKFFDIFDDTGALRGSFYLDLYAREKKRGGAWMDECICRRELTDGTIQLPVAYLTCNFNRPVGDKPALFTHDEVVTLFHEFGHGIHHMLTQIGDSGVSGINGVPWDAVELPSQFLENWCWQPEALAFISGHYETNEPLPQDLLDKMLAAKNFQSAMQMLRQLEFSLFDFTMHANYSPEKGDEIQAVLNEVRKQVAVIKTPEFNRFQHSFGHIFGGGYAAGYYSYKWAEVLSADAFSKFEEDGIFNQQTGQSFLSNILEKGGSQEPAELFAAFRGRAPQIDALLRHSGIE
ncbi:oligopeptidase A [Thalassotalea loyana]|uniref:oligopeptidase A n=1 Tax=Thalassotalea loyana TaxID=280483 RepID=A0ABQ6H6K6_9GAMM|nr:oligopeptidase A [Thalassotalea loyana]GLX83772.1 oligopeptidase A [Thalassotalea loyana]